MAAALKVSAALVYKWCEPPAENADPDQSGAKNPLDRVREMYLLTKDVNLVITADEDAHHGKVVGVIDLAKVEGITKFAINVEKK